MILNTSKLYAPQIPHAKFLLDSLFINGYALDSSQTGCGKTIVASWVAKHYNAPVIVICKRIGVSTWGRWLAEFGIKPILVVGYEKLCRGNTEFLKYKMREYNKAHDWWETPGMYFKFPKNSLVILDETHKCRGAKTGNGEMLRALINAGYVTLSLSASLADAATAMRNTGYALRLHGGKDYPVWAKEHGAVYDDFGTLKWDANAPECKTGMLKIHNVLYNDRKCASKMNREDFGTIFPDNQVIAESFDMGDNTGKLQGVYDQMSYELARLEERAGNYSSHHFAIMMEARRRIELLKVPTMIEWAEDCVDEGITPVIFFNFTDSLNAVYERLNKNTKLANKMLRITGGQSDKMRNTGISAFQSNLLKGALLQMKAGSDSISLHDLTGDCPRHSLLCPSWSSYDTLQALGRIHRADGKTKCVQKFIFASEIEERQRVRLHGKLSNLSQLNDGDLSLLVEIPL